MAIIKSSGIMKITCQICDNIILVAQTESKEYDFGVQLYQEVGAFVCKSCFQTVKIKSKNDRLE